MRKYEIHVVYGFSEYIPGDMIPLIQKIWYDKKCIKHLNIKWFINDSEKTFYPRDRVSIEELKNPQSLQ